MVNVNVNLDLLAKSNPEESIKQHTDKVLSCADILKEIYQLDEHLYQLLKMACKYHDYGKMNPEFQKRIKAKYKFNESKEVPHNLVSIFFLELNMFEGNENDFYAVFYSILHHHCHGNVLDYIYEDEKIQLLQQMKEYFVEGKLNYERYLKRAMDFRNNVNTILVKGLLHRCDYAASAGIPVEVPNDFLEDAMKCLLEKWQAKNTNAKWNRMQEFCKANSNKNIIVKAQTGMGKTEGALLWMGNKKGIYVLPLRSAINGIYHRLTQEIVTDKSDERIALMHSDNINYILNRKSSNDDLDILVYKTRVRQFTLSISISTPDQLFTFVFKVGDYEMKLATASYSKIVIDEIQAYDANMLAYIIYGIHEIIRLGGEVAIFTATLPGFVKDYLCMNGKYEFEEQEFFEDICRHHIKIKDTDMQSKDIAKLVNANKEKNNCNKILVVCNTIKDAQKMYDELDALNLGIPIKILHSKYTKKDRIRLEKEIMEDGRTYTYNGQFHDIDVIWIATSVVEASLDIDFDYLFTELSDLNALFQRLGRCNRKGKKLIEEINCYIYLPTQKPKYIDEKIFELSKEALITFMDKHTEGYLTEILKNEMINECFSTERMVGSNFNENYNATYKKLQDREVNDLTEDYVHEKFRNIISYQVIPKTVYEMCKQEIDINLKVLEETYIQGTDYSIFWERKQRARTTILMYTVDINRNDYLNCLATKTDIKLTAYEKIPLVDCVYGVKGFELLSKEEIEAKKQENSYGTFL